MQRRLTITCLCFAWICAQGVIWDAVQIVAWGRMFADSVRVSPVVDALRDTFDPAKPCALCRAVSKAKGSEEKNSTESRIESSKGKITFALETQNIWVSAPLVTVWPETQSPLLSSRTELVPVPPPRV
jgi:hypothetical protein